MTGLDYWNEVTGEINYWAAASIHEAGHAVMVCRLQEVLGVDAGAIEISEAWPDFSGNMMYTGIAKSLGYFLPGKEMLAQQELIREMPAQQERFQELRALDCNWRRPARLYKARTMVALAGFAAENIAGQWLDAAEGYENDGGGGNDLSNTEESIWTVCALAGSPSDDTLYSRYYRALYSLAYRSLLADWAAVERVSRALYAYESLRSGEICALYEGRSLTAEEVESLYSASPTPAEEPGQG